MNINRHNYETYFILYMDNELRPEERRMVEEFTALHPDLKEELDNLLQYKLEPDTGIVFTGKEELLKGAGHAPVNLTNYPEWLLLYNDNELDAGGRRLVEQFVATNPAAKAELDLLRQCRLQPEAIRFAHKDALYRREGKVRSLPVWWWRAAAAVLLLAIGLTVVMLSSRKSTSGNTEIAGNSGTVSPAKTDNKTIAAPVPDTNNQKLINIPQQHNDNPEIAANNTQKNANPVLKKENPAPLASNDKTINNDKKTPDNIPVTIRKEEPVLTENTVKPSNNLPQPLNNPNATGNDAVAVNTNVPERKTDKPVTDPVVTNPGVQPSDIVSASYKTNDAGFGQEEKDGKKSKLRGFFRKITRTFEKRTNINPATDDNKLLVAGWSINLK